MDTKTVIELAMIKCAVRHNPKDINEWCDTKTHGQMAKDLAEELIYSGYSLQKINPFEANILNQTELTTNDGE